jgi:hypothetical protein
MYLVSQLEAFPDSKRNKDMLAVNEKDSFAAKSLVEDGLGDKIINGSFAGYDCWIDKVIVTLYSEGFVT